MSRKQLIVLKKKEDWSRHPGERKQRRLDQSIWERNTDRNTKRNTDRNTKRNMDRNTKRNTDRNANLNNAFPYPTPRNPLFVRW